MIRNVGRGGCYILYFIVVDTRRKCYNRKHDLGYRRCEADNSVTARQCIKLLPMIAKNKPNFYAHADELDWLN